MTMRNGNGHNSNSTPPTRRQGGRPEFDRCPVQDESKRRSRPTSSRWINPFAASLATLALVFVVVATCRVANSPTVLSSSLRYCSRSRLLRPSSKPESNIILVASHLREGSDGELRLRVLGHNLSLLSSSSSSSGGGGYEGRPSSSSGVRHSNDDGRVLGCQLIFSFSGDEGAVREMVDGWRSRLDPAVLKIVEGIRYVPNDAVMVDASKWVGALYDLLPRIRRENSRVMLMNDSFLLTRDVPEMWDDGACGGKEVCGLAWTAPEADPSRHIQSYTRTLSSCAVERYIEYYEETKGSVQNVHELIGLLEINLDWAREGRGDGDGDAVSAMYDYAAAHPDADKAQRTLISKGYPAIKLKKFFATDDPWLSLPASARPRLPPSFSAAIYRRLNHDLNHLDESDLEDHFASDGKDEDRIYSTLPLVMKGWLREELERMEGGDDIIAILDTILEAKNRDLQ